MDAAEGEVRGSDNHRPAVVRQILGVAECLAGEPAVKLANAQVLAFRVVHGSQSHVRFSRVQRAVGLDFRRVVHQT